MANGLSIRISKVIIIAQKAFDDATFLTHTYIRAMHAEMTVDTKIRQDDALFMLQHPSIRELDELLYSLEIPARDAIMQYIFLFTCYNAFLPKMLLPFFSGAPSFLGPSPFAVCVSVLRSWEQEPIAPVFLNKSEKIKNEVGLGE